MKQFIAEIQLLNGKNHVEEVKYMHPTMQLFLERTMIYMKSGSRLVVEKAREFSYVEQNEINETDEVVGITDHTLRVKNYVSIRPLVIESKSICEGLEGDPSRYTCQVVAEIKAEIILIERMMQYPDEYCGILQNGSVFILVRRIKTSSVEGYRRNRRSGVVVSLFRTVHQRKERNCR
jgi:hypothetical protein